MNRPHITIDVLKSHTKTMYAVLHRVATSEDFKSIFYAQAFDNLSNLRTAVHNHCAGNVKLCRDMEAFANSDENYSNTLKPMIYNIECFPEVIIPTRPCDFMVNDKDQDIFFWIDERIEIAMRQDSFEFELGRLMVDPKSNRLLSSNGEDGWYEYSDKHYGISKSLTVKVKDAYENYLADTQILKD